LNQAILQLIVENQAGIPLLMKTISVHNDDKSGFRETIQAHIEQLTKAQERKYIVADSALYTESSLHTLAQNPSIHWISRVPETIKEAFELIEAVEVSEMSIIDEQTRFEVKDFACKNFNLEIRRQPLTMLTLNNVGLLFGRTKLKSVLHYHLISNISKQVLLT
jgi:transposase